MASCSSAIFVLQVFCTRNLYKFIVQVSCTSVAGIIRGFLCCNSAKFCFILSCRDLVKKPIFSTYQLVYAMCMVYIRSHQAVAAVLVRRVVRVSKTPSVRTAVVGRAKRSSERHRWVCISSSYTDRFHDVTGHFTLVSLHYCSICFSSTDLTFSARLTQLRLSVCLFVCYTDDSVYTSKRLDIPKYCLNHTIIIIIYLSQNKYKQIHGHGYVWLDSKAHSVPTAAPNDVQ